MNSDWRCPPLCHASSLTMRGLTVAAAPPLDGDVADCPQEAIAKGYARARLGGIARERHDSGASHTSPGRAATGGAGQAAAAGTMASSASDGRPAANANESARAAASSGLTPLETAAVVSWERLGQHDRTDQTADPRALSERKRIEAGKLAAEGLLARSEEVAHTGAG